MFFFLNFVFKRFLNSDVSILHLFSKLTTLCSDSNELKAYNALLGDLKLFIYNFGILILLIKIDDDPPEQKLLFPLLFQNVNNVYPKFQPFSSNSH